MEKNEIWKNIAFGTLAGIAGTMAIQGLIAVNHKLLPQADPPMRKDPGKFMIDKVKDVLPRVIGERLSGRAGDAVSTLLSVGYGSTGAALYTAFRSDPDTMLDGAALGAAVWAAGYLGWLPGLDLLPPIQKQKPAHIAASLGQHVVYGVATVAAYRRLKTAFA